VIFFPNPDLSPRWDWGGHCHLTCECHCGIRIKLRLTHPKPKKSTLNIKKILKKILPSVILIRTEQLRDFRESISRENKYGLC
jgi:uncharacterized protein Veg